MKYLITITILFFLITAAVFAAPAEVVYAEGEAAIKDTAGELFEVYIGDEVKTGDTVTTGYDGFVEMDQNGVILKINSDTVFTLMEREEGKEKTDVFSIALGSIKFRYDRLTGREPKIQTISCIAGVRGTELTVFSGVDGSTLIVVDKGRVEVEAEGETVELNPEEGVEVQLGAPPGEKFKVHRDQIDYSKWNEEKLNTMLRNPVETVHKLQQRMAYYIKNVNEYFPLYQEYMEKLTSERQKYVEIKEKKGEEIAKKYYSENVVPLTTDTRNLFINTRYFSLAALSMRRFVAGRIYLTVKSLNINKLTDSLYQDFFKYYSRLLESFEESIVPQLVEADI